MCLEDMSDDIDAWAAPSGRQAATAGDWRNGEYATGRVDQSGIICERIGFQYASEAVRLK